MPSTRPRLSHHSPPIPTVSRSHRNAAVSGVLEHSLEGPAALSHCGGTQTSRHCMAERMSCLCLLPPFLPSRSQPPFQGLSSLLQVLPAPEWELLSTDSGPVLRRVLWDGMSEPCGWPSPVKFPQSCGDELSQSLAVLLVHGRLN